MFLLLSQLLLQPLALSSKFGLFQSFACPLQIDLQSLVFRSFTSEIYPPVTPLADDLDEGYQELGSSTNVDTKLALTGLLPPGSPATLPYQAGVI